MDDLPGRLNQERHRTQAKRDSASRRFAELISGYDPALLSAALAALTIRPENADFQFRLESMIDVASSRPSEARLVPTVKKIRGLCTGSLSHQLVAPLEDPAECPTTQILLFDDHAYTAFSGQQPELVFSCEILFGALIGLAADRPDLPLTPTLDLIRAVLTLGESVAKRSSIDPDAPALHQSQILVPETGLEELIGPVRWSRAEVESLLVAAGLPVAVFDPLCRPYGESSGERFVPLLRNGDTVIVRPGRLLFGLARAVLRLAEKEGFLPLVAERYGREVHGQMAASILVMDARPIQLPFDDVGGQPTVSEAMFELDHDAVMLLVTITDGIDRLDLPDGEDRIFPSDALKTALLERFRDLVGAVQKQAADREILICVCRAVLPGIEYWLREFDFGGGADLLFVTPEALRVISHHEHDPLTLLRFAQALKSLYEGSRVFSWSALDEFAVYRGHGYSFHLNEEGVPPAVSIVPGIGLPLHQQMLDDLQRQSAFAPNGAGEMELVCASYPGVPIFVPTISRGQATRVVRLPNLDIWIAGEPYEELPDGMTGFSEGLIDAVAYWAWMAGSAIQDDAPPVGSARSVAIGIGLGEHKGEGWVLNRLPAIGSEDGILGRLDRVGDRVILWLPPGLLRTMASPGNEGEAHLARAITGSLLQLLGLGEEHLDEIASQIAPAGERRMILVTNSDTASMLGPDDGLPNWRKVSQWDLHRIRDELAEGFRTRGFAPGPAGSKADQTSLLNFAVEFCYERLVAEVAELAPDGLLEDLLRRNEGLLLAREKLRMLGVTRRACFGDRREILEPLVREDLEWSDADASHRFLIEYVAARPPSGSRTLSLARYDRIIALACLIIQLGMQSDIIKNELDDIEARIAPSGRLYLSPGKYSAAVVRWFSGVSRRKLEIAKEQFPEHWEPAREGPIQAPAAFEAAFLAEYGFSATDYGSVLYVLRDLAADGQASLAVLPRAVVLAECTRLRGVTADAADLILSSMTLEQRDDFLSPPPPFSQLDVRPWRFGRGLSLLARPLVRRSDDLVWGRRAVNMSAEYLQMQLGSGRLKARSKALQKMRSDISTAAGKAFEAETAERVRELGFLVKPNTAEVGGVPISDARGTLGDVDVLAADTRTKRIWAIECKAFAMARTPWEISRELLKFTDPSHGVAAHHTRRIEWLRAHLNDTLQEFDIADQKGWRIEPLIVLEVDLAAAHLHDSPMPITDLVGLPAVLRPAKRPSVSEPSASRSRARGSGRA